MAEAVSDSNSRKTDIFFRSCIILLGNINEAYDCKCMVFHHKRNKLAVNK